MCKPSTFTRRVDAPDFDVCSFISPKKESLETSCLVLFVACIGRIAGAFLRLLCLVKFNHADTYQLKQFPCGRVKRFLKNNTQNKMRVGAKGMVERL